VAYTDGNFKAKDIEEYLESYQNKKTLNMDEIWDINLFFKIALIERVREICMKIYISQMQKLKVESIIERLVENKKKDELKFGMQGKVFQNYGENSFAFIEYMAYRLRKYGKKGIAYLNILEEEIKKQGLSLQEVIKKEHFDIALKKVAIGNSIKSIHALQRMNFSEMFENINGVEEILKKDPSGIYENMDYKTKEYYRNTIKEIAKRTKISEIYISNKVIELASKRRKRKKRKSHWLLFNHGRN
jgi:cyclic beta-1,2-glucan synthetase